MVLTPTYRKRGHTPCRHTPSGLSISFDANVKIATMPLFTFADRQAAESADSYVLLSDGRHHRLRAGLAHLPVASSVRMADLSHRLAEFQQPDGLRVTPLSHALLVELAALFFEDAIPCLRAAGTSPRGIDSVHQHRHDGIGIRDSPEGERRRCLGRSHPAGGGQVQGGPAPHLRRLARLDAERRD